MDKYDSKLLDVVEDYETVERVKQEMENLHTTLFGRKAETLEYLEGLLKDLTWAKKRIEIDQAESEGIFLCIHCMHEMMVGGGVKICSNKKCNCCYEEKEDGKSYLMHKRDLGYIK